VVGYLRYATEEERLIISSLYRNELRLFKNFFLPVMKLINQERVVGKIHKKYDVQKTPYARLMESNVLTKEQKKKLLEIYQSLNPAELKRTIDIKLKELYKVYQKKKGLSVETSQISNKNIMPSMVSYYMMQP
jgi:hypothetical protein